MEKYVRQINRFPIEKNRSHELKDSLSRIAFDLASMKNIKSPVEEIDALESVWRELLKEYRELYNVQSDVT